MIRLEVKTDVRRLQKSLLEFRGKVIAKATSSAINKTTTSVRAAAVKVMRVKLKTIKAAVIRKRLFFKRSTTLTLTSILSNRAQKIPGSAFLIPNSNILRVRFGNKRRNIIAKSGKSQGKLISSGFQIRRLTNIEINKAFASSEVQSVMLKTAQQRLPILLEREFKFYSAKL